MLPALRAGAPIDEQPTARPHAGRRGRPEPAGRPSAASQSRQGSTVFEDIALAHREIYALYEIAQTMGTSLGVADTMALISSKLSNLVPFSCVRAVPATTKTIDTLRCRFATGVDAEVIERHVACRAARA